MGEPDAHRGAGGRPGGRRPVEPRDRREAVHGPTHRHHAPHAHLPEARPPLSHRAGSRFGGPPLHGAARIRHLTDVRPTGGSDDRRVTNTDLTLDVPPGSWSRPTAHFRLPLSATLRSMYSKMVDEAMGRLGRSYGFPIDGVDVHWLHGYP